MTQTQAPIPIVYRLCINTIEPLLAFGGAVQTLFWPADFLAIMAHRPQTGDTPVYDVRTHFLYTSLTGAWLLFAYLEAVVLRLYPNDVQLWKRLIVPMLLSDVLFCHSTALAVGGYGELLSVAHYTSADWLVCVTTWPLVLARVAFVLGVGLPSSTSSQGSRKAPSHAE
ncbi:hypothetical protein FA10DRAFT_269787 [Acaromyces ingoldii]|uniref:DUF7704 domain-containing protein n=1 Tax=Acaromyces ingoldii TaxID=215250 RepID=A0A316YCF6_9BASI|nr:hypothetical protein FA10DRAFT_269787 [Acaromyces ingoldii]PWN87186.1 hypothetical protein FA10DRAFT_269787 [Acaromyces ingoldii]